MPVGLDVEIDDQLLIDRLKPCQLSTVNLLEEHNVLDQLCFLGSQANQPLFLLVRLDSSMDPPLDSLLDPLRRPVVGSYGRTVIAGSRWRVLDPKDLVEHFLFLLVVIVMAGLNTELFLKRRIDGGQIPRNTHMHPHNRSSVVVKNASRSEKPLEPQGLLGVVELSVEFLLGATWSTKATEILPFVMAWRLPDEEQRYTANCRGKCPGNPNERSRALAHKSCPHKNHELVSTGQCYAQ